MGDDVAVSMKEKQNEYKTFMTSWKEVTKDNIEERFRGQVKMYRTALKYMDSREVGNMKKSLAEMMKKNAEEDMCMMIEHLRKRKKQENKRTTQVSLCSTGPRASKSITGAAIRELRYNFHVAQETDELSKLFHKMMKCAHTVMKEVKPLIPRNIRRGTMANMEEDSPIKESNKENDNEIVDVENRPSRRKEGTESTKSNLHRRSFRDKLMITQNTESSNKDKKKEVKKGRNNRKMENDAEEGLDEEELFDEVEDVPKRRKSDELSEAANAQQENANAEEDLSQIEKVVRWMHRDRLSEDKVDTHCFICRREKCATDNAEVLSRCEKRYTSAANSRCNTKFHMSCLKDYNAGAYDVFSLEGLQKLLKNQKEQIVCPLHHCDLCYFERLKSTAVKGELIQCKCCYRAFHDECRPAAGNKMMESDKITIDGSDDTINVKIQKTICDFHPIKSYNKLQKKFDKGIHLPFCCECEGVDEDEQLIFCSQCIRSFHLSCRSVESIKGNRYSDSDEPLCESCIHGESIRIGIPVICRYTNTFYPAMTVSLDKYPKHCLANDKYGKYLDKPGFLAVSWGGCQNLFSLLPVQSVIHMFTGSYDLIGKRLQDNDYREAWNKMEKNIKTPRPIFEDDIIQYITIKASTYYEKPVFGKEKSRILLEDMMCTCSEGDPKRCSKESNCTNRATNQECPQACEKKGSGCNNRDISKKKHHTSIKVEKTAEKGYGLIAMEDIQKNTFIAEYAGEIISMEEKNRRIELTSRSKNDEEMHYMMQLDPRRTIDSSRKGNISRFLNHSCDPNCKVDTVDIVVYTSAGKNPTVIYDKRIRIITQKDIRKGEELTFSYDMKEYNAGCILPECKCNSANCTGSLGKTVEKRRTPIQEEREKVSSHNAQSKESSAKPKVVGRKRKMTENQASNTMERDDVDDDQIAKKKENKIVKEEPKKRMKLNKSVDGKGKNEKKPHTAPHPTRKI